MACAARRATKVHEFVAHGAVVNCISIGRKSGKVVATAGDDKKINLWTVPRYNCVLRLNGHTTPIDTVKFHPNEDLLGSGSNSGAVKLFDLEAAKVLRTLNGHKASVQCIDFHPYGEFIASGSCDNTIKLWDSRKRSCINTYRGHEQKVNSIRFSPDGRWIVSGGDDGSIKLWDLAMGKMLRQFNEHKAAVSDVEFHPNEYLLASGSEDGSVKFYDLETWQVISSTAGESGQVHCTRFHPDGEVIMVGADDVMRVHSWEPTVNTFDRVVMGWGKVEDLMVGKDAVVAASKSVTNVCLYILDTNKVQPFADSTPMYIDEPQGGPLRTPTSSITSTSAAVAAAAAATAAAAAAAAEAASGTTMGSFRRSSPLGSNPRRSFNTKSRIKLDVAYKRDMNSSGASDNSYDSYEPSSTDDVCIVEQSSYNEIFHPSKELSRGPPRDPLFPVMTGSGSSGGAGGTGIGAGNPGGMFRLPPIRDAAPNSSSSTASSTTSYTPASRSPPRVDPVMSRNLQSSECLKSITSGDRGSTRNINNNNNNNINSITTSDFTTGSTTTGAGGRVPAASTALMNNLNAATSHINNLNLNNSGSIASSNGNNSHNSNNNNHTNSNNNNNSSRSCSSSNNHLNNSSHSAKVQQYNLGNSYNNCASNNNINHTNSRASAGAGNNNNNNNNNNDDSIHSSPMAGAITGSSACSTTSSSTAGGNSTSNSSSTSNSMMTATLMRTSCSMGNIKESTAANHHHHGSLSSSSSSTLSSSVSDNNNRKTGTANSTSSGDLSPMPTLPVSEPSTPVKTASTNFLPRRHPDKTSSEQSLVSIVKPVMSVKAAAVVHPEVVSNVSSCVGRSEKKLNPHFNEGSCSAVGGGGSCSNSMNSGGLNFEDFLPAHVQSLSRGPRSAVPLSENEALDKIGSGHNGMMVAMMHRLHGLRQIHSRWNPKDPRSAVEVALSLRDAAVLVDLLNVLVLRAGLWNLDLCALLLPAMHELIQSKYEPQMATAITAIKLVLKNFGSTIKETVTGPRSAGVDLSREERYGKCTGCHESLMTIRSFLLKRQTMQGKVGSEFRDLLTLMEMLD